MHWWTGCRGPPVPVDGVAGARVPTLVENEPADGRAAAAEEGRAVSCRPQAASSNADGSGVSPVDATLPRFFTRPVSDAQPPPGGVTMTTARRRLAATRDYLRGIVYRRLLPAAGRHQQCPRLKRLCPVSDSISDSAHRRAAHSSGSRHLSAQRGVRSGGSPPPCPPSTSRRR